MEHIHFGTVNGRDGRPFKTRAGGVFSLQDLLEAAISEARHRLADANLAVDVCAEEREEIARCIGVGAVKFADLQHERSSDYVFDLEKFTSLDGYTAPYIQYQAIRITSLLRRASEQGLLGGPIRIVSNRERELALALLQTPVAVENAYRGRAPHFICVHAYQIAKACSRLYMECPVLQESDSDVQASRISLLALTKRHLVLLLSLLGIDIPKQM
jgi:arginyl-tRNA synthetase